MAKAKKSKKSVEKASEDGAVRLPQNIVRVGERVEEDKNIYISQSVYKEIHRFTTDKTVNEAGGMLVGDLIDEFGKTNIIINGFVEAKECEATPTTLKFTHETWNRCHKEIEKKHNGKKILGWIHTHPNYGIFLSEYDKFIQQNFFGEDYEVAYVIDPIQDIEGFYFWINGKIERCKGFFVYDSTGKKIEVAKKDEEKPVERAGDSSNTKVNVVLLVLSVAVVLLTISLVMTNSKLNRLTADFNGLVTQYNQNMAWLFGGYPQYGAGRNPIQVIPEEESTEIPQPETQTGFEAQSETQPEAWSQPASQQVP